MRGRMDKGSSATFLIIQMSVSECGGQACSYPIGFALLTLLNKEMATLFDRADYFPIFNIPLGFVKNWMNAYVADFFKSKIPLGISIF
jgi:hypothetical protein